MDSPETLISRARGSLQVAEKMLLHTYPVVNDPKLLLAVAGDIYTALTSGMTSILTDKDITADDFSSQLKAFKGVAEDCNITEDDIILISELHDIMQQHKDSPVEFPRKDRFVICNNRYDMRTISLDDMKQYLFKAGLFVEKVERYFRARCKRT
jgi:hypothetical protein